MLAFYIALFSNNAHHSVVITKLFQGRRGGGGVFTVRMEFKFLATKLYTAREQAVS